MWKPATLALVFLSLCVLPATASPRQNAICVQNQLNALGHSPGFVDGVIGPQTRAAASAWLNEQDPSTQGAFPRLSRQSAFRWCRQLGNLETELAAFWPSATTPGWGDRLYFDESGERGIAKTVMVTKALTIAETYFSENYQIELSSSFDIVGAENAKDLNRLIKTWSARRSISSENVPGISDELCRDDFTFGFATRYLIGLCWHPYDPDHPYGWTWWEQHLETFELIAHEFFHMVQYELASDYPLQRFGDNRQKVVGPKWMTEGTAEYFANVIEAGRVDEDPPKLFWLYWSAYSYDEPLRELRGSGTLLEDAPYAVGHFAARILADIHGPDALLTYWTNVGRTQNWDQAFLDTFGMELSEFETDFEDMRKDIGQILLYIRARAEQPEIKASQ